MKKIKILVRGPALSASGYGEHCRFLLRSLKRSDMLDIYLDNTNWGQLGYQPRETKERREIYNLVNKTKQLFARNEANFDASVQVSIPNEFVKVARYNIGVTAGIEVDKISPAWIEKCNEMNKIITISEHSKSGFEKTIAEMQNPHTGQIIENRVKVPVSVVPYPVPDMDSEDIDLKLTTSFNFVVFALWGERKNLQNTIQWFLEEFKDEEDVGLIVKTAIRSGCTVDKQVTNEFLSQLSNTVPDRKCKMYLLHGRLTDKERNSLFSDERVKALATISHGEGFGLPIFEAACNSLPIVSPNWGGQCDFLNHKVEDKKGKMKNKHFFTKVEYDIAPVSQSAVWEKVIEAGAKWCYPKKRSYKQKLREVYVNYGVKKSIANKLHTIIHEKYDSEKIHGLFLSEIEEVISPLIKSQQNMDDEVSKMFQSLTKEG